MHRLCLLTRHEIDMKFIHGIVTKESPTANPSTKLSRTLPPNKLSKARLRPPKGYPQSQNPKPDTSSVADAAERPMTCAGDQPHKQQTPDWTAGHSIHTRCRNHDQTICIINLYLKSGEWEYVVIVVPTDIIKPQPGQCQSNHQHHQLQLTN